MPYFHVLSISCLFFISPKKLAFKNHQTWIKLGSSHARFARHRGFGVGMRHRLRTRIRRPPAWSVWQRPSGGSGVGGWNSELENLAKCLAYDGSIWIYIWIYMDMKKIYKQLHQLWWSKRWQKPNFHTLQAHDTAAMARSAQSVGWECGSLASRVSDYMRVGLLW